MTLEYESPEKLKKQIRSIIGKYINIDEYQLFFFGSRVSGENTERSDIDIGIAGSREIPALKRFEIKEEIDELPILYKIDVVDFANVSEDFKRVALKHIEYF